MNVLTKIGLVGVISSIIGLLFAFVNESLLKYETTVDAVIDQPTINTIAILSIAGIIVFGIVCIIGLTIDEYKS